MLAGLYERAKDTFDLFVWKWSMAMKNHAKNGERNVYAEELLLYVLGIYAVIGVLVILGCILVWLDILKLPEQKKLVPELEENEKKKEKKKHKWFSSEVVARHNTASDCWGTLDNKVYNLTKYIKKSPARAKILENAGGEIPAHKSILLSDIEEYFIGYLIEEKKEK
ncbi:cytochrome b5 heme-binding domain-containing protein [Chloropicon primus]|uniref:Cytochrome b5 heme-binding domain-containing protein n=1 Tax=Chloropicon primus TaxID=1764295 RepID=A0A5B8MCJ3_9CHLO|nr:hypothetical protein A3770_01p02820 [Chloropicon primus]UPQ96981.1 cytochrome b5 heme-binding domain-containing protein [Chloropicon primus]|eukprot:QDZ17764.1 hypothetical protein A3770_01p02820 [Chloropicon primus]